MRGVAGAGVAVLRGALGLGIRHLLPTPEIDMVPEGRILDLPGRGRTFVVDVPGPTQVRADDRAAARAGLHGLPVLGRLDRASSRAPTAS